MNNYFFLRMGSNAEKKYVAKMRKSFSGIIIRANFFESSPGMLSSLFIELCSPAVNKGYIIDPITYVFSKQDSLRKWQKVKKEKAYKTLMEQLNIDDVKKIERTWIRDIKNPTPKEKDKVEIWGGNKNYTKLCIKYFPDKICKTLPITPLSTNDFDDNFISHLIENVINYQKSAISSKYFSEKYTEFKSELNEPMFILAPYFNIDTVEWLKINFKIWDGFQGKIDDDKSAIVLNIQTDLFVKYLNEIVDKIKTLKTSKVFLWFPGFKETGIAQKSVLDAYAKFTNELSLVGKEIVNLYAGGFSTFMLKFGLAGVVNGPGYGLDKEIEPVIGGTPTAKYYIPFMHDREGILESFMKLEALNIGNDDEGFKKDVCDCAICKKGLELQKVAESGQGKAFLLKYYGGKGSPRLGKDAVLRSYSSSVCIERSFFHFMLSRLKEYKWVLSADRDQIIKRIDEEINKGRNLVSGYLPDWRNVLDNLNK